MSVVARNLIGREDELKTIIGLLGGPDRPPTAAVIIGDAGIGKTALWLTSIDAAAERGYRILSCRPSDAETQFSFAALTDLLDGASEIVADLPPVQRSALEAALLLGEPMTRIDNRAVAAGFLSALRVLAERDPVCIAADDIQWLDAASLAVLRYTLARLNTEPVVALLTVRGDRPEWLRRAFPEERHRIITVTGLSLGATNELVRTRLGAAFPRPTLVRLWQTSGGNPLFALELAAALQHRGGTLTTGESLPIPSSLEELLRTRTDGIGAAARKVTHAVAILADPTITVLEAALGGRGRDLDRGLTEAIESGILELEGEHVRFSHPLLGPAILARQTPTSRRRLHARLAGVVASAEERARHLALATRTPTSDVADALERAAQTVKDRGAPAAAADLAEHAVRLTPNSNVGDVLRRTLFAADMYARAGDTDRAVALLERARASAAPGNERAAVLTQLAGILVGPAAFAVYHEALAEAADEALRATIYIGLAVQMRWSAGVEQTLEYAEQANRAASHATGDVRCRALAVYGTAHFYAGRGIASATMDDAIALERGSADWPLPEGPTVQLGLQLLWSAEIERAREVLQELEHAAKVRNDPGAQAEALWSLGLLAWRAGDWDQAEGYVGDTLGLVTQLGAVTPVDEFPAAVLAAHRGRVGEARSIAHGAIARARAEGIRIAESGHGWVLGFVELSLGDAQAALGHLRLSYDIRNAFMLEPAQRLELGDLLEALLAVGQFDEAEGILATWQERATRLDRAWALAILARCRALLLAARSDLDGAFASFDTAFAEHARSRDPFSRGRTLLAFGRTQRRARRRGAARATLHEAMATFDTLGAPLWSDLSRAELARVGGRAPSDGDLTEAERRIAQLVAQGQTNREVATALFVTERTVETTLTRVYRKLGVRSRAALTRQLANS